MRSGKVWLGWLWLSIAGLPLFAGSPQQAVNLRFLDAGTGQALTPRVAVINLGTGEPIALLDRVQPDGRLRLLLPPGEYALSASLDGYNSIGMTLTVADEPLPPYELYLDPLAPPREVDTAFLWSLRRPGQMVVVGFVVDEQSGRPIEGVQVSVAGHRGSAITDSRGAFLLQFPVRDESGKPQRYATLQLQKVGYRTLQLERVELWSEGDWIYRLRMTPGIGADTLDMRSPRHREIAPCDGCPETPSKPSQSDRFDMSDSEEQDFTPAAPAPIVLPKYIRVGRNCTSRTNCQRVEVYTLETYCKGVITSEWYGCWGNLTGGMESLKAGAVAVRSYGVSFVYSPATSTYDICDSTSCQVFTGNQTSNGNAAVDATTRYVLLTAAGNIARAEYSAENNNAGCGDGYSGTGSSWPCIHDPVCTGFAMNGHGRGMCQWGSARWATGRRLSSFQACTSSAPTHGYGTKNWQQILSHYYGPAGYQLVRGATATIDSLSASPNPATTGSTGMLTFGVTATHEFNVFLGASIAPASSSNWLSDPARDLRVSIAEGSQSRVRYFAIPADATAGGYDVWAALWYDRNNSGAINTGDFMVDDRIFANLWQVRRATSLQVPALSGRRGETVTLQATLRQSLDNAPLSGQTLTFQVNNVVVGTAVTNSSGVATLNYTIPLTLPLGANTLRVEYGGNSTYAATAGSNGLTVNHVRVQGQIQLANRSNPSGVLAQIDIEAGSHRESFQVVLNAAGNYGVDTGLTGSAVVKVSIPNGSWLCQRQSAYLSNVVTLNFSLLNGDVDANGIVDDADLLRVLFSFGQTGADLSEDLNDDGVVDDADLLIVLFNFGSAC
ncbi:MAG: Ig-like domain repeat protein [Fimbriimonadales bacterium]|nr:Ig-like domain repeat protein [Fimbriimonadales bacterium]